MDRKYGKNKRKYSQLQNYAKQDSNNNDSIFSQAEQYPSFFEDNLVDDDRTIKIFYNHPHTHQTVYYFQLLKLIFETEDADYQAYLAKIYNLIDNPEFQFCQPPQHSDNYLPISDGKIKRILGEFLEQCGQTQMKIEQMLSKYPIMDKILVNLMRSMLVLGQKVSSFDEKIDAVQIYQFLSDYFQIEITYYTNCLRFNQTDIFVYFQADDEVYLAYILPQTSQQQLPTSQQYYQAQPQQAFNISSVRQMVSQIDIAAVGEECFNNSRPLLNQTQYVTQYLQYDYSQSQQITKKPSKSLQDNSQLKFSYLINQDSLLQNISVVKSNKQLQKEVVSERRVNARQYFNQNDNFFEIKQAPPELQNASSPLATPNASVFESIKHSKKNSHARFHQEDKIKYDFALIDTEDSHRGFKIKTEPDHEDNWEELKKQTELILGNRTNLPSKAQKNLKALYEMKSIKTIVSCSDGDSYFIDNPIKPTFTPSFVPSRKTTGQDPFKKNLYTKHGYVNNNISNQFTSSFIMKQLGQPYRAKIQQVKTRARKERTTIQKLINF